MEKEKAQAAEQAKVNVLHLTFLQRRHHFYGRLCENLFQLRFTLGGTYTGVRLKTSEIYFLLVKVES